MKTKITILLLIFNFAKAQDLNLQLANKLAILPNKCLQQEYPNKLNQMLLDNTELLSPKTLHPAFYGCFDWHSSVHGHWSLVYLLNNFENLENKNNIINKLKQNLSETNITKEIEYFNKSHEKSFERTYGWAWTLQLQSELNLSKNQELQSLAKNLLPLTNLFIERYADFLPKLLYPIRNGTHTNTAFGLVLAWDYAVFSDNKSFQKIITKNALRMFAKDQNAPFYWEPSGTDFLSPSWEEIAIMQRVLPKNDFLVWLKKFAKPIFNKKYQLTPAQVSDRTDGHLVHLDGLNFSRAWNLYYLSNQFPKELGHLKIQAIAHFNFSAPKILDGNYEGEHWLASFALRAFMFKD